MFEAKSNWLNDHQCWVFLFLFRDLVMPGWVYLNYNPKIYEKPFDFDPNRWEKIDQKTFNPYIFTPFSIGARGCLGQHFALL